MNRKIQNCNLNIDITLLQVAFIVLKLCKVVSWSWLWVLSPLWITAGICIIGAVIIGFVKGR